SYGGWFRGRARGGRAGGGPVSCGNLGHKRGGRRGPLLRDRCRGPEGGGGNPGGLFPTFPTPGRAGSLFLLHTAGCFVAGGTIPRRPEACPEQLVSDRFGVHG